MLYVKSIESNIKKGVQAELGPRTLVVGPNGSGKSSVIQAIELALGGFVSDAEGREQVKQKGALARLFPIDAKPFSRAILSDGQESTWDPKTDPIGLVSFQFKITKDLLASDSSTVRSWLSERVSGKITEEEILGNLVATRRDEVASLIKKERLTIDFSVIAAAAKKASTALKREATSTEKTIDAMVEGVPYPASSAELEKLKEELEVLKTKISSNQPMVVQSNPELPRLYVQQNVLSSKIAQLRMAHESQVELQAHIEQLISTYPDSLLEEYAASTKSESGQLKISKIQMTHALCDMHVQNFGTETCYVCGSEGGSIADLHALYAQHLEKIKAVLDVQQTINAYHKTKEAVSSLHSEIFAHEEAAGALHFMIESLVKQDERKANEAASHSSGDMTAELARIQEITTFLASQDSYTRSYQNAKAAKADVARLRDKANILSDASVELTELNKTRLVKGLASFQKSVSKYLCDGDVLGVDIESGRIGFVRDGQIHTALSGAEWSRLLVALSCYDIEREIAITNAKTNNKAGSTVFLIAPEDRAWDSITLGKVMKALMSSPAQVILMSTVEPESSPQDWTIIHTKV